MRINVNYYSRGNIGVTSFNNEYLEEKLTTIKYEVITIEDKKTAEEKIKEILKNEEWKYGTGYKVVNDTFVIYDKLIHRGLSCGYEEIKIKLVEDKTEESRLIKELIKVKNKIKENKEYIIEADLEDEESLLACLHFKIKEYCNEKKNIVLNGIQTKEIINIWIENVKEIDREYPGFAFGYEINSRPFISNYPFAYAGDCWDLDIDINENKLTIKTKTIIQRMLIEQNISIKEKK